MSSSVVTFREDLFHPHQIYNFAAASHLNYWDGVKWHWADQSPPEGSNIDTYFIEPSAGAVTYFHGARHIFAFYLTHDLWLNHWDGTQWSWANHGNPVANAIDVFGPPTVITFPRPGHQRIYAFVVIQGQLWMKYWNGLLWKWTNLEHHPNWLIVNSNTQAITYFDGSHQRIYVFGIGGSNLIVCYWNESQWTWADLGTPPGTSLKKTSAIFEMGPGVVTYSEAGTQWIYVFAVGENGHLLTNYWNGSQWTWADQGVPPGTKVSSASKPEAISYIHEGVRRIYVFMTGTNDHLYLHYWNGIEWKWVDQGTPGGTLKKRVAAATYSQLLLPKRRIHVFVTTTNDHHYQRYWNGSQWTWVDQGEP